MRAENELDPVIPIREAAKAIRKSVYFIKTHFIDTGKVEAFRTGGNDSSPWLRVRVSDLQRALEEFGRYTPPALRGGPPTAVRTGKIKPDDLNPGVRGLYREIEKFSKRG